MEELLAQLAVQIGGPSSVILTALYAWLKLARSSPTRLGRQLDEVDAKLGVLNLKVEVESERHVERWRSMSERVARIEKLIDSRMISGASDSEEN